VFGEPILVASDADRDVLETKRGQLEAALAATTAAADRAVKRHDVPTL
jgi:hypothetical protein